MALTLPYPDLDFVPLDILTAEEMNEIVANYTYIANQFPPTVPYVISEEEGTINLGNTTAEAILSATIPESGTYLCIATGLFGSDSATIHEVWLDIMKNGAVIGNSQGFYGNQQGQITGLGSLTATTVAQFTTGDTLSLGAHVSASHTLLNRRTLIAVRVGV